MPLELVLTVSLATLLLLLVAVLLWLNTRTARASHSPMETSPSLPDPARTSAAARPAGLGNSAAASAAVNVAPAVPPDDAGNPAPASGRAENERYVRDPLHDPATGLASPRAWELLLEQEDSRFSRYGHPATVLVIELDGIDALIGALGDAAGDRLILPVAATLRLNARSSDTIARAGYSRFLALLPETDEIAAIGYVDRVRTACDTWLEAGEVAVRLAIGWAQPASGGRLADAMPLAEKRMHGDRRRGRAAASPAVPSDNGTDTGPGPDRVDAA